MAYQESHSCLRCHYFDEVQKFSQLHFYNITVAYTKFRVPRSTKLNKTIIFFFYICSLLLSSGTTLSYPKQYYFSLTSMNDCLKTAFAKHNS